MMDFMLELYKNDNFTLYLTIALVVLVVLFVIVLLFGKRDQKLEETKKLQKIEVDAFKEEEKEPTKVEVVDEAKKIEEPVKEVEKVKEEVNVTTFEPNKTEVDEDKTEVIAIPKVSNETKPLLADSEDSKPISMDELPELKFDEDALVNDLNELENIKKKFNEINIPEIEKKEEIKPGPKVFSSVFVPESNEEKNDELKKETNIFAMDDDEDTIELPTLKSIEKPKEEEKVENAPLLSEEGNSFSFDAVEGERYNLK